MIKRSESKVQSKTNRKRANRKKQNRRLMLEGLENRQLLAAGVGTVPTTPVDLPTFTGPRNVGTVQAFTVVENETSVQSGVNDIVQNAQLIPLGNQPGQESTIDLSGNLPFTQSGIFFGADLDTFAFDLKAGDILDVSTHGAAGAVDFYLPSGQAWTFKEVDPDPLGVNESVSYPSDSPLQSVGNIISAQVVPFDGRYYMTVSSTNTSSSYTLGLRTYRPAIEATPVGTQQILYIDMDGAVYPTSVFSEFVPTPGIVRIPSLRSSLPLLGIEELDDAAYNLLIDKILAEVEEQFASAATNGNNGNFDSTGVPGEYGIEIRNSRDHADPGVNPLVTRVILGGSDTDSGLGGLYGISSTVDIGNFSMDDIALAFVNSVVDPAIGVQSVPISNTRSVLDASADFLARLVSHEAGHSFGLEHTLNTNTVANIIDQGGAGSQFGQRIGVGPDGIYGTLDDVEVEFVVDEHDPGFKVGTFYTPHTLAHTLSTGTIGTAVSGVVYNDANRNAVRGNEAGVAGVQVFADVNGNGILDEGEPRSVTGGDGAFSLATAGGTVSVIAVTPDNYVSTTGAVLSSAGTLAFGIAQVQADITGTKFADINGNGIHDTGEAGVGGVYIYLDLDGDDRPDLGEPSAQTAADGTYSINFPGPGTYTIREVVPAGYQQTFPTSGEHVVTFDGVTLGDNFDFGNRPTRDYGDAPSSYLTLSSDNGPSHGILGGLKLGAENDSEVDGVPSAAANGDDSSGIDDEDGVTFSEIFGRGDSSNVAISVLNSTGLPGYLQGWIDFDGNGTFDASERVATDLQLATGTHSLQIDTPANATLGSTYARFRYSHTAGLGVTGAADTGEVEDYLVTIANDSGIAQDDEFNVSRNDLSVALDVLANDLRSAANPISIQSINTSGTRGVVTLGQGGTQVFYTPPNNFIGRDAFTYTVVDQFGNPDTATAVVNVQFQTANPIAIDDALFVPQNSSNRLLNVLDNDIASVNGGLTITSVFNASAGGSVSVVPGGQSIRYTPSPGFAGTEQFGYSVQDAAGLVSQATVTVNMTPNSVNDDLIEYSFEAKELVNGTDITQNDITVGQEFELTVYVEDLRNIKTVSSAFLDVLYTDELLSVDPTSLVYGDLFTGSVDSNGNPTVFQTNDASTPGLLNEFGGTHNQIDNVPAQAGRVKLFSITVQAVSPGIATIQADPADFATSESIVDGVTAVTPAQMRLGNIAFRINPAGGALSSAIDDAFLGQSISANNPQDSTARVFIPAVDSNQINIPAPNNQPNVLDVLANDLLGATGTVVEFGLVTQPGLGVASINNAGTPGDLSDDFIQYTASPGTAGADSFQYLLVTGDGVRSVATVDLTVGQSRDYDIALTFDFVDENGDLLPTDTNGRPVVGLGDTFGVQVNADDVRNQLLTEFVFAAYLDLLYDSTNVSPIANLTPNVGNPLDFRADFGPNIESAAAQGFANRPGIIDEFGAPDIVSNSGNATRPDPRNVATVYFTANATGVANFAGSPADNFPFHDSLIFLENNPVPVSRISYDSQSIVINGGAEGEGPVQNTNLPADTNADGFVTPIDALLIVNALSVPGGEGESTGLPSRYSEYMLDVTGDKKLTPSDALAVVNYLYHENERRFAAGEGIVAAATAVAAESSDDEVAVASSDAVFGSIEKAIGGSDSGANNVTGQFTSPEGSSADDEDEDDLLDLIAGDINGRLS